MDLDIKNAYKITLILNTILLTFNLMKNKSRISNLINNRFLFQKDIHLILRISNKLEDKKVVAKKYFLV